MNCPQCGSTQVHCVDSRDKGAYVKRRRECLVCLHRFNTIEITEGDYKKLAGKKINGERKNA